MKSQIAPRTKRRVCNLDYPAGRSPGLSYEVPVSCAAHRFDTLQTRVSTHAVPCYRRRAGCERHVSLRRCQRRAIAKRIHGHPRTWELWMQKLMPNWTPWPRGHHPLPRASESEFDAAMPSLFTCYYGSVTVRQLCYVDAHLWRGVAVTRFVSRLVHFFSQNEQGSVFDPAQHTKTFLAMHG